MSAEPEHFDSLPDRHDDADDVEPNGTDALKPLHELDDDASSRVVTWVISDQDGDAEKPTVDDVVETIEQAEIGLMFSGSNGIAYVKPRDDEKPGFLHWKYITNDEKVAEVADVERRDKDDVRITKAVIDEATIRQWIHLAIDTGRLMLADVDDLSVFENPASFDRNGGRA